MIEVEINKILKECLDNGFSALNMSEVLVKQAYNPSHVGAVMSGPSINFHKLDDKYYGHRKQETTWDPVNEEHVRENKQKIITRYQISALVTRDVDDEAALYASDYLTKAKMILESEESIDFLKSNLIGIIRITGAKNPFFKDGADQNESAPFFEISLSHDEITRTIVKTLTTTDYEIHRV